MVVLRDIRFESHCGGSMTPSIGRADVDCGSKGTVGGVSKLVRLVEAFACRFQVQEKMTTEIAEGNNAVLHPAASGSWSRPCTSA